MTLGKYIAPVSSGGGGSFITNIQHGVSLVGTNVITISEVDLNKRVILAYMGLGGASNSVDFFLRAKFISSTQVDFGRFGSTSSAKIYWQVIEFEDVASLQSGQNDVTNQTDITITSVDTSKSMAFMTFAALDGGSANSVGYAGGGLINGTTLRIDGNTTLKSVQWYVAEFN